MADDDTGVSLPQTEPHPAPIFDTGPHLQPLAPLIADPDPDPAAHAVTVLEHEAPPSQPLAALAQSVVVPSRYHVLPWWKFVLVLAAVWLPAAGIGFGLFSWWYSLVDKTPAVFVVLIYAVVCTVAALMLAMVENKPLVAALAIGVMTAVFASTAAAAPLYGHYYCQVQYQQGGDCLAGIIPY